jgi:CPA2 family monovalent cation:H+ antiporter-2
MLGASALTMAAGPALVMIAPRLARAITSSRERRHEPADDVDVDTHALHDHVVILGFGVGGQLMVNALRELGQPFVVLELNARTVREAASAGVPIRYGDASNPAALESVALPRARALVALVSDPDATRRAVRAARQLAPELPILARVRFRTEADDLHRQGATLAVAEELEASLEVLAQLLMRLGVPGNALELLVNTFRRETTSARPLRAPATSFTALPEAFQRSPVATHGLQHGDWAVGKTLAEIELRATTGATVLLIDAGGKYIASPAGSQVLKAGQVLYLMGDESDILLARARLTQGPIGRSPSREGGA